MIVIIIGGIMLFISICVCIALGGADIGKNDMEIGKWLEMSGEDERQD